MGQVREQVRQIRILMNETSSEGSSLDCTVKLRGVA